MLNYIYTVLQDLLMPATLLTLMAVWFGLGWSRAGMRYVKVGVWTGFGVSVVMAVIKNTTKVFKSTYSVYTMWLCLAVIVAALLFIVPALCGRKRERPALTGVGAALFTCLLLDYKLSTVIGYLFNFDTNGGSILSADYAVRLVGWLIALSILYIYIRNLYRCGCELKRLSLTRGLTLTMVLVVIVRCL